MPIEVLPARREELERVNALRRMVNDLHVQGRPKHFRPGFGKELQQRVFEQFESDQYGVVVALLDGAIVGFAVVQYIHRPEGPYTLPLDYCRVEEFGVDAAHRREGVASALLAFIKRDAQIHGLHRIDLDVWSFNTDALAFYEAAGFTTYRRYMELDADSGGIPMSTVHIKASTEYDVRIGEGLIDKSGELTAKVVKPGKCLIVTDDTVDELYGDRVQISFTYSGFEAHRFAFPAGESSKNLDTLADILNALGEAQFSRSDLIVALGGGVVGDMAGFAAAIYTRGIRFVQIPTTLLAAVDSSVGGKTAVDMPFGKNMVGAFHQPSLVLTDTDVLRELPPLQLSNGAAEAVKCGLLNDPELFALLETGNWLDRIDEVVERCVSYKRDVVAGDEFDTGSRAFLNLGHTFGHAIETLSSLTVLHGQAVAIGMVMAASAAGCGEVLIRRLAACLKVNGLPTRCDYDADALARAALSDKKRAGGSITLVLPEAIGKCALKKVPVAQLPGWFERALDAQEALGL